MWQPLSARNTDKTHNSEDVASYNACALLVNTETAVAAEQTTWQSLKTQKLSVNVGFPVWVCMHKR